MNKNHWVVYLICCSDGSVYCGISNRLEDRIAAHNSGKGAKYTHSRRPVELLAVSYEMTKSDALKMEYRIKQVSADRKIFELKKGREKMTMNLKKELQKISDKINMIAKMVDKLMDSDEMPEKSKAAREKPNKKAVVQKSAREKNVVQKSAARKISAKKSTVKKTVVEKKKVVKRDSAAEKTTTGTAVDTVLGLIRESENGITTAGLMGKTGFNEKKVQNLIFKLKKRGDIKSIGKGVYVKA